MHARAPSFRAARAYGNHNLPRPHPILLQSQRDSPKRARHVPRTTAADVAAAAAAETAPVAADASPADAPAAPNNDASALVDRVLRAVAGSDGGVALTPAKRDEVDALLQALGDRCGVAQRPRPLGDPLLFGDYEVAYTSPSRAPGERGQPAGGRFRGRVGRLLFRTTGVFQSVLPLPAGEGQEGKKARPGKEEEGENAAPGAAVALAVNKVSFKLFGLIPGYVGLRGLCYPCARPGAGRPATAREVAGLDADAAGEGSTVRVRFERPVLSLGPWAARIGPPSGVVLTTTYLDERVRLGKGSRGSLFVFARGGAASDAGMSAVGTEKASGAGRAAIVLMIAAMVAGGAALWRAGAGLAAAGLWLAAAGLTGVTSQGGIEPPARGAGGGGGGSAA